MVVEHVQFYISNHYHQKMKWNFVYCNYLFRYYRSRLNILSHFCIQRGQVFLEVLKYFVPIVNDHIVYQMKMFGNTKLFRY